MSSPHTTPATTRRVVFVEEEPAKPQLGPMMTFTGQVYKRPRTSAFKGPRPPRP